MMGGCLNISDKITKLIASKWGSLAICHRYTQKDSSFKDFILNHIDPTCNTEILKTIVTNSGENCKYDMTTFCDEIRSRATNSIKIIKAMP